MAQTIADQIRVKLNPREQAALKNRKAVDPEAYEAFLKGRYFWNKRTAKGLKTAVAYFHPADSYALLGDWQYAVMTPKEAFPKAKAAAIKALELDSTNACAGPCPRSHAS